MRKRRARTVVELRPEGLTDLMGNRRGQGATVVNRAVRILPDENRSEGVAECLHGWKATRPRAGATP